MFDIIHFTARVIINRVNYFNILLNDIESIFSFYICIILQGIRLSINFIAGSRILRVEVQMNKLLQPFIVTICLTFYNTVLTCYTHVLDGTITLLFKVFIHKGC